MDLNILWENFDVIIEAENGIQCLRDLILDLAIRGKLVPQNSQREEATELLKKIREQRKNLIKSKSIRNRKISKIQPSEKPFSIPFTWTWARLGEITHDLGQEKPDTIFSYIDVSAINGKTGTVKEEVTVINPENAPSRARKLVKKGTVIYSTVRPYLLNIAVIKKDYDPQPIASTAFSILHPYDGLFNQLLYYLLRSRYFTEYVELYQKGVAYPAISDTDLLKAPVPLPPLEEQKRIVSKVDELMKCCDRAQASKKNRNELQQQLRRSAIHALETAETEKDFKKSWHFVRDNFSAIVTQTNGIKDFRDLILDLAIRGKLVPQNSQREEATELLKKIREQRKKLIKSKSIRNRKISEIQPSEKPFSIPFTWTWARLGEITHDLGQKKPDTIFSYIDVSAINGKTGTVKEEVTVINPENAPSRARKLVKKGTVIYSTVRPYLLNIAVIKKDYDPQPIASTAFSILHPYDGLFNQFLYYLLRGRYFTEYVELYQKGVAYPAISDTDLLKAPVPLPPLEEQKRIVSKVDELMKRCDRVEESLRKKEELASAISASVIHHLEL
ncbi:restriction endonuclease subunit S [Dactylococcopsis salina]|uniref:Restriction endonuclease S subunit n=1 Tax=Dactylococcopsis salina (strain PCC 8305) TaxID=13035 RepID=K9YYY3_DACS8|nr:restriction endonuclease subunit S [Dactylococcopsis salina]AFZ51323.1 restriction endonuclease S subunit [Dactylococcopsis salina PCC 8305]